MPLDRRLFTGKLQSSGVYPEFFPLTPNDRVVNLGCGVGPQVAIYKGNFNTMVCVDISKERLEQLREFMEETKIHNYETCCAPVEQTGLGEASFDRALCIDIIEHLKRPMELLEEVCRLLRSGGKALITIPVMHDHWVQFFRFLKRSIGGTPLPELPFGHPDHHNISWRKREWLHLFAQSSLQLESVRATTLFPPLHLTGCKRFWFTVPWIHTIDRLLCSLPFVRNFGQSWMCILIKP